MKTMTEIFKHGYALLIGVGECECQQLSLSVTVKDTQAIYEALIEPDLCAYSKEQIRVLNNETATKDGILDGLHWLKEKAQADSEATIFIYYSGHGGVEGDNYYLIPHDYDIFEDNPLETAVSAAQLTEALREINSQHLLVVIDSCHAAGMATSKDGDSTKAEAKLQKALKDLKRVAPSKGLIETLTKGKGRAVFTSSQGEQKSYWLNDESMSIYTYHFLEALQGLGNKQGDTEVKLSDLMGYLDDNVPKTALQECNAEQNPDFDLKGNFAIAPLRGGKGLPNKGWDEVKSEATQKIYKIADNITQNGKYIYNISEVTGGHFGDVMYQDSSKREDKSWLH
jgi:uncharacterized caspase-like protein